MRGDMDRDVQRPGGAAARADLALVRQPDLVALVDAGGDRHPQRSLPLRAAVALARLAWGLDDLALASTARARADVDHLPEHRLADAAHLAPTLALRTGRRLGPGLAAPVPLHVSHRPSARNSISFSVPLIASSNVMRMSYRRSEPGCGLPRRADPDAAPPKNASKMSLNPPNPSKPAPAGPPSTPARPNVSYRWRRSGSDRIWYASLASLKRAGACGSLLTSGCHCWASLRKARLISASLAPRWTPSTSYRSRSVVAIEREVYERASSLAVVMTASNIAGVSLPVNVFCWLGWYEPISRYAPTSRDRRRDRTSA